MRPRRFAVHVNEPLPALDYAAAWPFAAWKSSHLTALVGGWLQMDPPCLELATLAYDELARRRDDLQAGMKFVDAGLPPVPWLADARKKVLTGLAHETPPPTQDKAASRRGRGHVYVVLRGGYTRESGWYGAYVGSTIKTPARRFVEHRKGVRAARGLPRHGIELCYSLFAMLNPVSGPKSALREWETRLHEALAPVVPKVTGDVAF